jgi:hypothetical protein
MGLTIDVTATCEACKKQEKLSIWISELSNPNLGPRGWFRGSSRSLVCSAACKEQWAATGHQERWTPLA